MSYIYLRAPLFPRSALSTVYRAPQNSVAAPDRHGIGSFQGIPMLW